MLKLERSMLANRAMVEILHEIQTSAQVKWKLGCHGAGSLDFKFSSNGSSYPMI